MSNRDWTADVLEFMKLGHPEKIAAAPTMPHKDIRTLCRELIQEEVLMELLPELERNENIVEIADGIVDSIYVLLFAAHCYGIPVEKVWPRVQQANMAKFRDEDGNFAIVRDSSNGKILKPSDWVSPTQSITRLVAAAVPFVKLFCPRCGKRHHDFGVWAERPHRTHLCVDDRFGAGCNTSFRVQRSSLVFGSGED